MASIGGQYDQGAEPESRDVMPEHECTAHVTESDYKSTKSGNGKFIALTWELLDGPHKGRKVWANLNVQNPSKIAQDIGNAEFAAIRIALFGSKDKVIQDTAELHSIPCRVKVGISVNKETKEQSNVIKKYIGMGAASAPTTSAGVTPPWNANKKAEDRF